MTPISPLAPAARFRAPSPMTTACAAPRQPTQTPAHPAGRHLGHRPAIRIEGRF